MKSLQLLFAQPLAADLGWTLLHFVWEGALISALFAGVRRLGAGSTSVRARYALACLTLATMASAPILTYGFLAGSDTWQSASAQVPAISTLTASGGSLATAWYLFWLDDLQRALPWLVMAWFTGAVVFVDSLGGWFVCRSSPAVQCEIALRLVICKTRSIESRPNSVCPTPFACSCPLWWKCRPSSAGFGRWY